MDGKEISLEKIRAGLFSRALSRQPDPHRSGSPVAYHLPLFCEWLFRLAFHRVSGERLLRAGGTLPWTGPVLCRAAQRVQPCCGKQSVRSSDRGDHAAVPAVPGARVWRVCRFFRRVYGVRVSGADPHARRCDLAGGFAGIILCAVYRGPVDTAHHLQDNACRCAVRFLYGPCGSRDSRLSSRAGDAGGRRTGGQQTERGVPLRTCDGGAHLFRLAGTPCARPLRDCLCVPHSLQAGDRRDDAVLRDAVSTDDGACRACDLCVPLLLPEGVPRKADHSLGTA